MSPINPWLRDCDPDPMPPMPGASEREVGRYLNEMGHCWGELTAPMVTGYCRSHGHAGGDDFNLAGVFKELRREYFADLRAMLGPIPNSDWGWASLEDLDRPGYVVRCPTRRWGVNRATGMIGSYLDDCRSPLCPRCTRKRSESDLRWACWMFENEMCIWTAVVPYDKGTIDRVKQRRSRAVADTGVGLLWVHRIDTDTLHFYSSEELTGTHEPVEWILMSRNEALKNLTSVTLALPGPKERRFSGSWKRPTAPPVPPKTFDLGRNHPRELMELAEMAAEHELKIQHGLRLSQLNATEIEEVWLPLVKEARDEEWDKRMINRLVGER